MKQPVAIHEDAENRQEKSKYEKLDQGQPENELYLQPIPTYENITSDQEDIYEEMAEANDEF